MGNKKIKYSFLKLVGEAMQKVVGRRQEVGDLAVGAKEARYQLRVNLIKTFFARILFVRVGKSRVG